MVDCSAEFFSMVRVVVILKHPTHTLGGPFKCFVIFMAMFSQRWLEHWPLEVPENFVYKLISSDSTVAYTPASSNSSSSPAPSMYWPMLLKKLKQMWVLQRENETLKLEICPDKFLTLVVQRLVSSNDCMLLAHLVWNGYKTIDHRWRPFSFSKCSLIWISRMLQNFFVCQLSCFCCTYELLWQMNLWKRTFYFGDLCDLGNDIETPNWQWHPRLYFCHAMNDWFHMHVRY